MSKIAVVYWSGTGNTEAMANAIVDGARTGGPGALFDCDDGVLSVPDPAPAIDDDIEVSVPLSQELLRALG